jgi:hypothetical protein
LAVSSVLMSAIRRNGFWHFPRPRSRRIGRGQAARGGAAGLPTRTGASTQQESGPEQGKEQPGRTILLLSQATVATLVAQSHREASVGRLGIGSAIGPGSVWQRENRAAIGAARVGHEKIPAPIGAGNVWRRICPAIDDRRVGRKQISAAIGTAAGAACPTGRAGIARHATARAARAT